MPDRPEPSDSRRGMPGLPGFPVRVGCCGFPVARREYYARFDLVEVQQTFYEPPRPETAARWRREAPPGFTFAVKAWQLITHPANSPTYRRLRRPLPPERQGQVGFFRWTPPVQEAWAITLAVARALEAPMILLQTPASFEPTAENRRNLERFFTEAERDGCHLLWEFRGEWRPSDALALCRALAVVPVVDPFIHPPPRAAASGAPFSYWRLHGIGGYGHRFSDQELDRLVALLDPDHESFVLFNNAGMLEDAERFRARLQAGPGPTSPRWELAPPRRRPASPGRTREGER